MEKHINRFLEIVKILRVQGLFFFDYIGTHMSQVATKTLEWVAVLLLHCASIPSLMAFMSGLDDSPFNADFVLFIYTALVLLFIKSIISKDTLNTITIGIGFVVQAVLMSLILAK
jgi:hypothetical protein